MRLFDEKTTLEEEKEIPKKEKNQDFFQSLSLVSELGFVISFPLVGGVALGVFLDKKFSSYPKLTLSFLFLGCLVAFANLFYIINEFSKKK